MAVFALLLLLPLTAAAQGIELKSPRLEVLIPGINFSQAVKNDRSLTVPFLAQYITGLTRFLVGIAGVFASVMLAVGGFQYLTAGGDKTRIEAGKKRIQNALTGLILALGSYVLLYTINPSLVAFKGLEVFQVQTQVIDTSNTDADVSEQELREMFASPPTSSSAKVPLYLQWAPEYKGELGCGPESLRTHGCGPTSLAMVFASYGVKVSPMDLFKALFQEKYLKCAGGTSSSGFLDPKIVGAHGFEGHKLSGKTQVIAQLQKGRPVIISAGASIFTTSGHYIVLTGMDGHGNLSINDPNKSEYDGVLSGKKDTTKKGYVPWTTAQCPGDITKNGDWSICVASKIDPPIKPKSVPEKYVWPVMKSAVVLLPKGQQL